MKTFVEELTKLDTTEDISVFWTDNIMYVNDQSENSATEQIPLFEAYKFALFLTSSQPYPNINFDYEATDEEVKEFGKQLLELVDEKNYAINVWDYIDDISNNLQKFTNKKIGIDDKRHIISNMADIENQYSLKTKGSATFIAKMLYDKFKNSDSHIVEHLIDKHLQTDNYDVNAFKNELNNYFDIHYKHIHYEEYDGYIEWEFDNARTIYITCNHSLVTRLYDVSRIEEFGKCFYVFGEDGTLLADINKLNEKYKITWEYKNPESMQ